MGEYRILEDLPFIEYEKKGKLSGKYPVYFHDFVDFTPTEVKAKLVLHTCKSSV